MSRSHLISANSHRAKEGARVLEDIARFMLHDETLFQQIRALRHSIQAHAPIYNIAEDLGGIEFMEGQVRFDMLSMLQANALCLQEALRVLEEMAVTASNKQHLKVLRYQAYHLHARLYAAANKYLKTQALAGLYLIIDTDVISYPLENILEIINQSPVSIVQYRNKTASKQNIFETAYQIKQQLAPKKLLIINDHIDIALDLGDGVHIGQDDYPLERIRNIITDNFILGISCHNLKEARAATQFDVSYIAVGCLFETRSKSDTIPVSIDELKAICCEVPVPVCGIGGINENNLDQVIAADIKMAALISYVWKTENPLRVIKDMHEKILSRNLFPDTKNACSLHL